jgi:hypothetical protein
MLWQLGFPHKHSTHKGHSTHNPNDSCMQAPSTCSHAVHVTHCDSLSIEVSQVCIHGLSPSDGQHHTSQQCPASLEAPRACEGTYGMMRAYRLDTTSGSAQQGRQQQQGSIQWARSLCCTKAAANRCNSM